MSADGGRGRGGRGRGARDESAAEPAKKASYNTLQCAVTCRTIMYHSMPY